MSSCSYVSYAPCNPDSRAVAALTLFSRTGYYAGSACNRPDFYSLPERAGVDGTCAERARCRHVVKPVIGAARSSNQARLETLVIEVQHITKRYGGVTAVDDVSFRVERGEILGFLGPNGAGKTTTMRILTGYMPPTDGRAAVAGFDVFTHPVDAKRRTGYLPETPPLYPDMTVREYLDFVSRIKGVPSRERKDRVGTVMKRTHIADMADRHCSKLSKGYRQRVGLAQALIHNPEVLILDEPTAGLDPKQIIETRQLIRTLAGDHTIVLSTHILPEVAQTCQRVVIINKGRVVAVDTPDGLTARLQGAETLYVEVDAPGVDPAALLQAIPGVTRVGTAEARKGVQAYEVESGRGTDIRRDIARTVVTSGWGLLELRPMRMSLEDIFLQVTTEDVADPVAPVPPPAGDAVDGTEFRAGGMQ